MKYDSNQLSMELVSLNHNKELAFQQYHKICGAVEMLEAMQKTALEHEKEESKNLALEKKGEMEIPFVHMEDC